MWKLWMFTWEKRRMKEYIINQGEIGKILVALRSRDYNTARNVLSELKENHTLESESDRTPAIKEKSAG